VGLVKKKDHLELQDGRLNFGTYFGLAKAKRNVFTVRQYSIH